MYFTHAFAKPMLAEVGWIKNRSPIEKQKLVYFIFWGRLNLNVLFMKTVKLQELEVGDIFVHINDKAKNPTRFLVKGIPEFNLRHGRPTRKCVNLKTHFIVGKSCPLDVYKVGESKYKDKLNEARKNLLNLLKDNNE